MVGIGEWARAYATGLAEFAKAPFLEHLRVWFFDTDPDATKRKIIKSLFDVPTLHPCPGCNHVWTGQSTSLRVTVYIVKGTGPRDPPLSHVPLGDYAKAGMHDERFDAVFVVVPPEHHIPCARGWRPYI